MVLDKQKDSRSAIRIEDIGQLEDLLSESVSPEAGEEIKTARKLFRAILTVIVLLLLVVAAVVAGGFFLLKTGFEGERLNSQAEQTIQSLLGPSLVARLASTRLSLDSSMFLAIEAGDVSIVSPVDSESIGTAGTVQLGVDPISILSGNLEMRSARISDARLSVSGISGWNPGRKVPLFQDASGRVDPSLLPGVLYGALSRLFDIFDTGATQSLEAENIVLDLPDRKHSIVVSSAQLNRENEGTLQLQAQLSMNGTPVQLSGLVVRDTATGRIEELKISVRDFPLDVFAGNKESEDTGALAGLAALEILGEEAESGSPNRVAMTATISEITLPLGRSGSTSGSGLVRMSVAEGDSKVEVDEFKLELGKNRFEFNGAFGPLPDADTKAPIYRYEFVSDGSTLSPDDSPEAPLHFLARFAGTFDPESLRLSVDKLGVRTNGGEILGTASVVFDNPAPAIFLAIRVPELPVGHAKQLWPSFAAPTSRSWVLDNVFGGMVTDSNLEFSVVSGRLGNGVPLNSEEVFGHFQIKETRFDSAGDIPPVRDAKGSVDFRGTDVDIGLSEGTAFLPSGRSVAATDGTLMIRKAHIKPVVGKLDIKIAGEAGAVAELAEFKPFDALRNLEFGPNDLEGQVKGRIFSEVPIGRPGRTQKLDWRVELDYQDLSIAVPIAGQLVSEAIGTLIVTPEAAAIEAKAKLNGASATVDLVEPLGASSKKRKRRVVMKLGDKERAELLPGLDAMLTGPVSVDLIADLGDVQKISADLTESVIQFPWIGWRKGKGIPADASFVLSRNGSTLDLSEFRLQGDTFSVDGAVHIDDGELVKATFSKVSLNRDEDFELAVERGQDGYALRIAGKLIDMRSIVKLYSGDFQKAVKLVADTPISVVASVETARGHHGELLRDLDFEYRGNGSRIEMLRIAAATDTGAGFNFRVEESEAGRSLEMESADAGSVLRFLDVYERMEGGSINSSLTAADNGPFRGSIDARDFWLVDEPRLSSIVASKPQAGGRDLNSTLRGGLDVSRVYFDRGYSNVELGGDYAKLSRGILRGPTIGTSFRGTLYDSNGQISIAGTFMPAYGLNSLLSNIPLIGQILGNGREGGLLGITYKLQGPVSSPGIAVNPISLIAPGVFRSVFEFR